MIDKVAAERATPKVLQIMLVDTATLALDDRNARAHGEKNLKAIEASLRAYGQQKPIVVSSEGVVLAGNGTLIAARALGWSKISAVVFEGPAKLQSAFAIADNRTAELAEWDSPILSEVLQALRADDVDLSSLGFDDADLETLLGDMGGINDDIADALGDLAEGEKAGVQSMSFVLSDDQAADLKRALKSAKDRGPFVDTGNENSNGNALARVVEHFLGGS